MDINLDLGPPAWKKILFIRCTFDAGLTYLGDVVEVEVDVIRVTNLAPQEPDRVGGDGSVPHTEPFFPPRSVSHRVKDQRPVFTPSCLKKEVRHRWSAAKARERS